MQRYLVTAGNTREMIDRVRDWGNVFTGNTGYGIARAIAAAAGDTGRSTCSQATPFTPPRRNNSASRRRCSVRTPIWTKRCASA